MHSPNAFMLSLHGWSNFFWYVNKIPLNVSQIKLEKKIPEASPVHMQDRHHIDKIIQQMGYMGVRTPDALCTYSSSLSLAQQHLFLGKAVETDSKNAACRKISSCMSTNEAIFFQVFFIKQNNIILSSRVDTEYYVGAAICQCLFHAITTGLQQSDHVSKNEWWTKALAF